MAVLGDDSCPNSAVVRVPTWLHEVLLTMGVLYAYTCVRKVSVGIEGINRGIMVILVQLHTKACLVKSRVRIGKFRVRSYM